jgi:hypothetical protein
MAMCRVANQSEWTLMLVANDRRRNPIMLESGHVSSSARLDVMITPTNP